MYYDLELVKLVVGAGADVNAIDNDGVSLLPYNAVVVYWVLLFII